MGYGATDADRPPLDEYNGSIDLSDDDVAIVPKGTLDPVYEAKARLLNRAVCAAPIPPCVPLHHEVGAKKDQSGQLTFASPFPSLRQARSATPWQHQIFRAQTLLIFCRA
jgi:hypothetical protein